MIGQTGIAVDDVDPEGIVEVGTARWRARTNRATPVRSGEPVRVAAIDGITLEIEPLEGAARDYRERRHAPSAIPGEPTAEPAGEPTTEPARPGTEPEG